MQFGSEQSTANTARCGVCICNAKTCSVWRGNAALRVQCGSALRGGGMCRGSRAEEILSLPLLKSSACMQPEIEMKGWSWDYTGALLAAVRGNVPQVTSLCSHWGHTGCEKDNQLLYCYTSAAPV